MNSVISSMYGTAPKKDYPVGLADAQSRWKRKVNDQLEDKARCETLVPNINSHDDLL